MNLTEKKMSGNSFLIILYMQDFKRLRRILKKREIPYQHVVKISAPVLVIRIVCSNCAAGLPSAVRVVQLSGHVTHSMLPIVRMGSAIKARFME